MIKPGDTFEHLTVIEFAGFVPSNTSSKSQKLGTWRCVCACGAQTVVKGRYLTKGETKSCGCLKSDSLRKRNSIHGMSGTRTYASWAMMIQRCTNPNFESYERYGGAGVTICKEWMTFENFYKDMGVRPPGKSLDRIDNNQGYHPGNCRWSTDLVQAQNRRAVFRNSKTGVRGVMWREDFQRYAVSIGENARQKHLGLYQDFFEACCVRKSAERSLWGSI